MRVEQIAARPDDGGRAITKAAELLSSKLRRVIQSTFTVIDVSLARSAFEEHRNGEQLLSLFNGAHEACRRALADIPLPVKILVVALSGRNELRIDVEIIAFD